MAVEVVIASEQQPTGFAEVHAGDRVGDVVIPVGNQLLVGPGPSLASCDFLSQHQVELPLLPDIEKTTGEVVASGGECVTIGEKLNR